MKTTKNDSTMGDWEKEFDEEFSHQDYCDAYLDEKYECDCERRHIKAFIAQALHRQRKELSIKYIPGTEKELLKQHKEALIRQREELLDSFEEIIGEYELSIVSYSNSQLRHNNEGWDIRNQFRTELQDKITALRSSEGEK